MPDAPLPQRGSIFVETPSPITLPQRGSIFRMARIATSS